MSDAPDDHAAKSRRIPIGTQRPGGKPPSLGPKYRYVGPAASAPPVPWLAFLRCRAVWAVIVAHFCYNWGYYTLLAWLPSYFELSLGLNVQKSSLLTLIPYLAMTAMTPPVGPVADGLVAGGWSVTSVRKLCQGISFAGPALCMCACAVLTPLAVSGAGAAGAASRATTAIVALLSVAFALGAWARAGLYCNHQDLSPKYAGALLGLSNTAGALPGVLGVTAVGVLLDKTGSWGMSLFYPTAACQLFGDWPANHAAPCNHSARKDPSPHRCRCRCRAGPSRANYR